MNSSAAVEIREERAQDLPALLGMMRSLAEHPPAFPLDENEVRAAFEAFLAHAELGQARLLWLGEKRAGYVILTFGYSFEFRGGDAFIDELYIEPEFRRIGLGRRRWNLWRKERAR